LAAERALHVAPLETSRRIGIEVGLCEWQVDVGQGAQQAKVTRPKGGLNDGLAVDLKFP
jgi:hypothetical protein